MTLAQWIDAWPYGATKHENGAYWAPIGSIGNSTLYRQAFRLSDYLVWRVSGGSLWFVKREEK